MKFSKSIFVIIFTFCIIKYTDFNELNFLTIIANIYLFSISAYYLIKIKKRFNEV